mgnify:FL=1
MAPSGVLNYLLAVEFKWTDALAIVGVIVLIMFSAFFSASETAFTKANMLRLRSYADEKKKGARRAIYICEHSDKALSTILVGNNLVNIASTTICAYLFSKFIVNPTLSNLMNTVIMTIIILTFGEILPKSISKADPDKIAMKFSGILYFLMKVLTPISFVFGGLQKLVSRKNKNDAPTVTEDELESIIDTMNEEGVIDNDEADILQGAIDIKTKTVGDIMTPRVDIVAISIDDSLETVKDLFIEHQFSRMPVYENDKDNIVGILNQKDFMIKYLKNEKIIISDIMTEPSFVTETMKVDDVIRLMQKEKKHLAIVLDEYGGTSGIVSMEDAIEEVVGEIYDEHDDEEPTKPLITKVGENKYILDPEMSVEDLYDYLEIEHLPEENYSSVGTMLYELSEKLPTVGEKFTVKAIDDVLNEHNDYVQIVTTLTFTITKMDERRIDELLLEVERGSQNEEKKED